jgi:hypothetical protein
MQLFFPQTKYTSTGMQEEDGAVTNRRVAGGRRRAGAIDAHGAPNIKVGIINLQKSSNFLYFLNPSSIKNVTTFLKGYNKF